MQSGLNDGFIAWGSASVSQKLKGTHSVLGAMDSNLKNLKYTSLKAAKLDQL